MRLQLGSRDHDLASRALVMAILNRTPDSFVDRGAHFEIDALLRRADEVVSEGADILDVGGVKAGPGPEVSDAEELDRVLPAVEALRSRFDLPISVDTWRASVASAAFDAGAVMGNDISGFSDGEYLRVAARARATVVATHIRLAPRVADPDPHYDDVVVTVRDALVKLARRAEDAGLTPDRIVLDAGLDLGKTWTQSLELLRASRTLASIGYPLLLSASNKTFLGKLLDTDVSGRGPASLAAVALGVAEGVRIVRVHDARGTRRVVDVIAAVLEANDDHR